MKNVTMAICLASLLCSCPSQPTEVDFPRLTKAKVLELADAFAKQKIQRYEKFDLKFYPERAASFDPKRQRWSVHYDRKPMRFFGDFIIIFIDDRTGKITYQGGM